MEPVHESASHGSENEKEKMEDNGNSRDDDEHSPKVALADTKHDSPETIAEDLTFRVDDERTLDRVDNSKAAPSSSSSSSDSSLEHLFEVDPKLTPVSSKLDIDLQNIETPKPVVDWSSGTTSSPTSNSTQHPAMQVMERTAGYDPQRLPSSIFARNSSNSVGWSVASNESLFSLNFGNNSLSRDNSFVFEELQIGENYKPDEHHRHHESDELNWFGQPRPPPLAEENGSSDDDKDGVSDKKPEGKISGDKTVHEKSETKVDSSYSSSNLYSPSVRYEPNANGTSSSKSDTVSRKKKSPWRFCQCTNCRWNFFYGFKRKQKPCYISSEESFRKKETPPMRNKSLQKQASEKTDSVESRPSKKKNWCSYLSRPCSSFWSCC